MTPPFEMMSWHGPLALEMTSCSEDRNGKNAHLKDEQEIIADFFSVFGSVLILFGCSAIGRLGEETTM